MTKVQDRQSKFNEIQMASRMMKRSSNALSLSGLSGISAGVNSLIASVFAYLKLEPVLSGKSVFYIGGTGHILRYLLSVAIITLVSSFLMVLFFNYIKSKRRGFRFGDQVARRVALNLAVPLLAGGIFCAALVYYETYELIVPAMLIFYGLAMLNSSRLTFDELRVLGYLEILLGVISLFNPAAGILLWAIGFGVLNLAYGFYMHFRYDR